MATKHNQKHKQFTSSNGWMKINIDLDQFFSVNLLLCFSLFMQIGGEEKEEKFGHTNNDSAFTDFLR